MAGPAGLGVPREGTLWTTAPRGWPRNGPLPPKDDAGGLGAGFWRLQLASRLDGLSGLQVVRPEPAYLFETGVVEATAEVRDPAGELRAVFAYPETGSEVSAEFAAVRALFEERGLPEPVCYAPGPLSLQAKPRGDPRRPLALHHFCAWPEDQPVPEGPFALWWATDADVDPLGWTGAQAVERAIRAAAGLEEHLIALLQVEAEQVEPGTERVPVPEGDWQLLLAGPDGLPVLATHRAQEGLLFRLPVDATTPEQRDLLWGHLAGAIEARRDEAEQWGIEPGDGTGGLSWWQELNDGLYDEPTPPEVLAPVHL